MLQCKSYWNPLQITKLQGRLRWCELTVLTSGFSSVSRCRLRGDGACVCPKSLRPTLCDPMDCSSPGSSVHGTLQARILEWVAIHSLLQRTFPNQGSNPGLLHCKQLPYRLSYRGWGGYSLEDKQHYAFHFACALMFRHASNWSVSQPPGLGTCFFSFNLITPLGHLFRFRTRTPGSITFFIVSWFIQPGIFY